MTYNNKKSSDILFKDLSYSIIGACFKIHNRLGCCLPEHCYEFAFIIEFDKLGIPASRQQCFKVLYDDEHVGHFFTDIIVDSKIILEFKSTECITSNHISQLLTYLRGTNIKVGYVINFGVRSLQFKRLIV